MRGRSETSGRDDSVQRDYAALADLFFQQPYRCCNLTSLAFGLSALGYPTTVDDIFHGLRIPVATVLDDGMTLSETHDVASRYVALAGLPIACVAMHFDTPGLSAATMAATFEAAVQHRGDVHVLNFDVGIAQGNPRLGGGHFSLLADYDPASGEVTIADANPRKYGRFWTCPVERLYAACAATDPTSERARGLLSLARASR